MSEPTIEEHWLPIEGLEAKYRVSNRGEVFSIKSNKILNKSNRVGYHVVTVGGKTTTVHRLVAKAFIPNPLNKRCVNHIDGDKTNNRVDNLEWVTDQENERHSFRVLGKHNSQQKLTQEQVDEITQRVANGEQQNRVAEDYNVSFHLVNKIVRYGHRIGEREHRYLDAELESMKKGSKT